MNELIELKKDELIEIEGGVTFAYRVGQFIRFAGYAALIGCEDSYYMNYSCP
jgi:hypothetical protein